jgi:Kdo2-lipid IVA lauroyltransferase/acyltransferase
MKKLIKRDNRIVRDYIGCFLLKLMLFLGVKLNHRMVIITGKFLGNVCYYISVKHRNKSINNLKKAFGDSKTIDECRQIARKSYQYFVIAFLECSMIHFYPESVRKSLVDIEGWQNLQQAVKQNKGVIGLTAHFGNFVLLPDRLIIEGYKASLVVKGMRDAKVEQVLEDLRVQHNFNTIYLRPPARCARNCLQALRDNHILILLGDQRFRKGGVVVDFFGMKAATAPGAASLALSTGAPVVPMFMIPRVNNRHMLVIEKPVELIRTGNRKKDIQANIQRFTNIIESYVRRYPQIWSWNHSRWKLPKELTLTEEDLQWQTELPVH